jgi:hypothetical protein
MAAVNSRREKRPSERDFEPTARAQGAQPSTKNGRITGLFRADQQTESEFAQVVLAEGVGFELSVPILASKRLPSPCGRAKVSRAMPDVLPKTAANVRQHTAVAWGRAPVRNQTQHRDAHRLHLRATRRTNRTLSAGAEHSTEPDGHDAMGRRLAT